MRRLKRTLGSLALAALIVVSSAVPMKVNAANEETVDITILETSDLHGCIYPHDYATDQPSEMGLAKVATVVKQERVSDPDLILVDCGDSLQGNFISDFRNDEVNPMVKAMNLMKYDCWQLGNHEFNYEFSNLEKAIAQSNATVLGGNIYKEDGTRYQAAYKIIEVKGVKVAVFGMTAPHINRWESDPSHYNNMTFTTPMEETDKILAELEGKADVVIALVHYGEEGEYNVQGIDEVAMKYQDKVDAFLVGHAHAVTAKYLVDGAYTTEYSKDAMTLITEPGSNGKNVSKVVLSVNKETKEVVDKKVELISTLEAKPDQEILDELAYVHNKSVETANTVVGSVAESFYEDPFWLPGIPYAVIEDGPLIDLINTVQMELTGADVSLAALFDSSSNLVAGDFKKKDGVKVYKYDNTLMAVKVTGAQLKAIMEKQAGNFFNQYKEGDVTISFNENIRLYNYDMFAGVDYQIDISKPAGERIVNVMYQGEPLKDDEELVLALNNYRYGGLSGDGYISAEPDAVVYDSAATSDIPAVRDMIAVYVSEQGGIKPECDHNWEIIGYDFDLPEAETVYEMIRNEEISIPKSADGRTSNVKAVNVYELYEEGVLEAKEDNVIDYVVVKGDVLSRLAKTYGCTVNDLLELNPEIYNADLIFIGQTLKIPA